MIYAGIARGPHYSIEPVRGGYNVFKYTNFGRGDSWAKMCIFVDPVPLFRAQAAYRRLTSGCTYCVGHANDPMMPPHSASERCESGRRNHCTCEVCY